MNASSTNPPSPGDGSNTPRWIDTGSGPGWSPDAGLEQGAEHRPWCAEHYTDPDEPQLPGLCTATVEIAPGVILSASQEPDQAVNDVSPVVAVSVTDTPAAESLTVEQARTLIARCNEFLDRLS